MPTKSRPVTGRRYIDGADPTPVTGWLLHKPNTNGYAVDSLVPVTLLTAEGERYVNVLVRVIDLVGNEPRNFTNFTDQMLWRIDDTNMGGLGERALAELTYRHNQEQKAIAAEKAARLEASQRAAAMLKTRTASEACGLEA